MTALREIISGREHPKGADFVIIYTAEIVGGEIAPGDDADLVQFFPRRQLPHLCRHPCAVHHQRALIGVAIVNMDDRRGADIAAVATRTVTYAIDAAAEVRPGPLSFRT